MKKNIKDFIGRKAVVHVKTQDEWDKITKLLNLVWSDGKYNTYKENTCIEINNIALYGCIEYYKNHYSIYPASDFLEDKPTESENFYVKVTSQEEWDIMKNYVDSLGYKVARNNYDKITKYPSYCTFYPIEKVYQYLKIAMEYKEKPISEFMEYAKPKHLSIKELKQNEVYECISNGTILTWGVTDSINNMSIKDKLYFSDHGCYHSGNFRLATKEQREHLKQCIQANKYVDYVPKQESLVGRYLKVLKPQERKGLSYLYIQEKNGTSNTYKTKEYPLESMDIDFRIRSKEFELMPIGWTPETVKKQDDTKVCVLITEDNKDKLNEFLHANKDKYSSYSKNWFIDINYYFHYPQFDELCHSHFEIKAGYKLVSFEELCKIANYTPKSKNIIPEYVECIGLVETEVLHWANHFKIGGVYKLNGLTNLNNYSIAGYSCDKSQFKPSTKEAYDAQFKLKEMSKEELLAEAKRRYPIGTKVKGLSIFNEGTIIGYEHFLDGRNSLWLKCKVDNILIYRDGNWAEIVSLPKPKQEQVMDNNSITWEQLLQSDGCEVDYKVNTVTGRGKITIESGRVFICQKDLSGFKCVDKKGFPYSYEAFNKENDSDYFKKIITKLYPKSTASTEEWLPQIGEWVRFYKESEFYQIYKVDHVQDTYWCGKYFSAKKHIIKALPHEIPTTNTTYTKQVDILSPEKEVKNDELTWSKPVDSMEINLFNRNFDSNFNKPLTLTKTIKNKKQLTL